mmetsp:Transcript_125860/g.242678  ORF Transcript_125860/g.242678 Transcript_125860/m.242678 type:complete len:469 (-) Transcript_125860:63-1469(-)
MGGPLDQTHGHGPPDPKGQLPHDELQAMLKRLDELLAGTLAKRSVPLPEEITSVWSTSFAALQGFVQFVATFCREDINGTKDAALEKSSLVAGELRDAVAQMQEARLAGHVALASDSGADSRDSGCSGASLRALCPRCQELYEWAPSYYANSARSAVSERLGDLRKRCEARAEELRKQVALERGRLREVVDSELEGIFAARQAPESESAEEGASKAEPDSQGSSVGAEAKTEEQQGILRLQKPKSTLEMIRQRTSQIRRQRTRRLAGEQLDALRRAKAAEVMGVVEDHLEEAWQHSMGSWLEEAMAPPLMPKQEVPTAASASVPRLKQPEVKDSPEPADKQLSSCRPRQEEQAAKNWRTRCALDFFETASLTPGATPCETPRTPQATLLKGTSSPPSKTNGTPAPCRLLDQQRQATPHSTFRIDVMDDVQEAYRATFSGQDVVRDFEQNYDMFMAGRQKPVNLMADDV